MKWFSHQSQAHQDTKLQKVLIKYGFEGYGLYWYCLENICSRIEPSLNFDLEHDSEILAHHGNMDSRKVEEIMRYMVNIGLFTDVEGVVVCRKIAAYLGTSLTRNSQLTLIIRDEKEKLSQTVSDSLGESGNVCAIGEDRIGEDKKETKTLMSSPPKSDPVRISKIIELYHEKLPSLPSVRKVTKARESVIKQRCREDLKTIEQWGNFFDYVSQSDFLMGRVQPLQGRTVFVASLEWICKASNYTKILEENYHGV
tara:strand:- start:516 stop:1280 length:765 start_codon:yes stop_codon:yes gene_type:complete